MPAQCSDKAPGQSKVRLKTLPVESLPEHRLNSETRLLDRKFSQIPTNKASSNSNSSPSETTISSSSRKALSRRSCQLSSEKKEIVWSTFDCELQPPRRAWSCLQTHYRRLLDRTLTRWNSIATC